jgi:hypothetical protein
LQLVTGKADLKFAGDNPPLTFNLDELQDERRGEDRDMTIFLYEDDGTFHVNLYNRTTREQMQKSMNLSRATLAAAMLKTRDEIKSVVTHPVGSYDDETAAKLPEHGRAAAFADCFEHILTAGSILHAELAADENFAHVLAAVNALPPGSRISITTESAFLPWEILYPKDFHHAWNDEQVAPRRKTARPLTCERMEPRSRR